MSSSSVEIDTVIFGGGAAGLWLLDDLRRAGSNAILLEAFDLGSGQTIASQGIIHGGVKYALSGLFTAAAGALREMPMLWRLCLSGEREPNLSGCRIRAEFCYLWRTASIASKLAMIGARAGLRVKPQPIDRDARPAVLAGVPGTVSRLDEQVIEPASFLEVLASRNRDRILKIDFQNGLEIESSNANVLKLRLTDPETGEPIEIAPRAVVFLAGKGNEALRAIVKLPPNSMQRRPLHMVVAKGNPDHLPELNGHCIDGASPRLTITSTIDFMEHRFWQIGGRFAEDGVQLDRTALVDRAREEVTASMPGLDLSGISWSTYKVDRAEASTGGTRPDDISVISEGNIITAWPTKLALVPRLAETVFEQVRRRLRHEVATTHSDGGMTGHVFARWPRPAVALPPWETETQWITDG